LGNMLLAMSCGAPQASDDRTNRAIAMVTYLISVPFG
jgi:hypothetical protein